MSQPERKKTQSGTETAPKNFVLRSPRRFIFENEDNAPYTLEGNKMVKVDVTATNDPKGISDRPWSVQVKAAWDIAAAKFTSQKITDARRK